MSEQITEEELEAWTQRLRDDDDPWGAGVGLTLTRLIAEVRSLREELAASVVDGNAAADAIEEQAKEIERLQMGIFREETGSENMVGKDQGT